MVNNVIGLPLARFAAGVDQRGGDTVKSSGLAVGIGFVLIGIQHLNLIPALQVNAAIASALALTFDFTRRSPLNLQLNSAKLLFSYNIAGTVYLHCAVVEFPFCFTTGETLPLRQILTVKQHDGI